MPNLAGALKAVDAGVDGLIVEGGEGGGFKSPRPVSTMVLLPLVVSKVDVPVIAAGGFVDGATMAAALALGAEGVQLGTRMVSSAESPIHDNWKQAVLDAGETDTVFLNQHTSPALRALRTDRTNALEFDTETNAMALFGNAMDLYFGGRHGGRGRAVGPGGRAHRRDQAGGRRSSRSAPATAWPRSTTWRRATRPGSSVRAMASRTLIDHGTFYEGPRWHDGRWWVSDFYRRLVLSFGADGGDVREELTVEALPSGLGWAPDGSLLVVSQTDHSSCAARPTGRSTEVAAFGEHCGGFANDMVVDAQGRAYIGNAGFDLMAGGEPSTANLVRVDLDGTVASPPKTSPSRTVP